VIKPFVFFPVMVAGTLANYSASNVPEIVKTKLNLITVGYKHYRQTLKLAKSIKLQNRKTKMAVSQFFAVVIDPV